MSRTLFRSNLELIALLEETSVGNVGANHGLSPRLATWNSRFNPQIFSDHDVFQSESRVAPVWRVRAIIATQCELLSLREFRRVVARERCRTDRTGDRFCLLSVEAPPDAPLPDFYLKLAKVLRQRLRLTDEAGWLDQHRVGIVLPSTAPRGAWILAADVCQRLSIESDSYCRVYCYPSESDELDQSITNRRQTDVNGRHPGIERGRRRH